MKKLIALVMVATMVMSMGVVAFAATDAPAVYGTDGKFYKYNSDTNKMTQISGAQYGATFYMILEDVDGFVVTKLDSVSGMKIKPKWEMGADFVESINLVKKLVNIVTDIDNSDPSNPIITREDVYIYCIEIKTKLSSSTAEADLVGTLTLSKTKEPKIAKDTKAKVEITLFWDNNYNNVFTYVDENGAPILDQDGDPVTAKPYMIDGLVDTSDILLKPDTYYLLKFDYDDEVDFEFGTYNGGKNEGVFTVDVSGQGKLLVNFNTKANEAIDAANPAAITKYVNFNGVTFNRSGTLFLESPEGAFEYIYAVVDGKLFEIPTAEYDDYDEGFYVKTRTLGAYVLSDVELVNPAVEAEVTAPEVPVVNPGTGAAA